MRQKETFKTRRLTLNINQWLRSETRRENQNKSINFKDPQNNQKPKTKKKTLTKTMTKTIEKALLEANQWLRSDKKRQSKQVH